MGSRNADRIDISEYRGRCQSVGDMYAAGWEVITQCRACRVELHTDLRVIMAMRGRDFVLWNRTAKCKKVRCRGVVDFLARLPGRHDYQPIIGAWPVEKRAGFFERRDGPKDRP